MLLKEGYDFVYVHVEAPDEMGHQGSVERKVQSIEYLDQRLIAHLKEALDASGEDYRMFIMLLLLDVICVYVFGFACLIIKSSYESKKPSSSQIPLKKTKALNPPRYHFSC